MRVASRVRDLTDQKEDLPMAERSNPFRDTHADMMSDATSRVKADMEHLVEGFDVQTITQRIEEFGRENPVGLALTALTLGVAVGFLMKPKKTLNQGPNLTPVMP
jgi:hypothetical protein